VNGANASVGKQTLWKIAAIMMAAKIAQILEGGFIFKFPNQTWFSVTL